MKKSLFLFLALTQTTLGISSQPQGRNAKFYYFEITPGQTITLEFESIGRCSNGKQSLLSVSDFEGTKSYLSSDSGKDKVVNVKNYYVGPVSTCSASPGKGTKKLVIGPFKETMTHVRITTIDDIALKQL